MKLLPPIHWLLYAGTGGAIGATLRFSVSWWLQQATRRPPWMPYAATTLVNVLGCLAIGWFFASGHFDSDTPANEAWRIFLVVGILGGFTTFSAFGYETLLLLQDEGPSAAAVYLLLQLSLGLGAVFLAVKLA